MRSVTTTDLKVLIAAPLEDVHARAVLDHLTRRKTPVSCLTPNQFILASPSWSPGGNLSLTIDGRECSVGAWTTVWWRRPGSASANTGDELEDLLVTEEVAALFPGMLAASAVRWVDAPWTLVRARLKPLQLAIAQTIGVSVPDTLITGDATSAREFGGRGDVLAKAASTGIGIAPHVATVPRQDLRRVSTCPTTLQREIPAATDLRIVTIGDHAHIWERRRTVGEPVDWRAADPHGRGFRRATRRQCAAAVALANRLELTFSVQDWLSTDDGDVFLEVNPQGQWLFLDGAEELIVPSLADLLEGISA